ncbi:MAG: 4Fe-4S dicluster domain-containing protein, partial [Dermatophilaceae bacterium]
MGALGLAGYLFGRLVEPGLQVRADRCLRASGSDCRQCVDICPAGALRLGPPASTEAPQSLLSQCTDCGLCAATCPAGAITGVGVPAGALTREAERQSSAMSVLCAPARRERPRSEQDPGFSVSCLAALHPETVVATALALQPGSTLTLTQAQCSGCPAPQQVLAADVIQKSIDLLQRVDDGGRAIVVLEAPRGAHASPPGASAQPSSPAQPSPAAPPSPAQQPRPAAQPSPAQPSPAAQPSSPAAQRRWSRRELFTALRAGDRADLTPAVTPA